MTQQQTPSAAMSDALYRTRLNRACAELVGLKIVYNPDAGYAKYSLKDSKGASWGIGYKTEEQCWNRAPDFCADRNLTPTLLEAVDRECAGLRFAEDIYNKADGRHTCAEGVLRLPQRTLAECALRACGRLPERTEAE